MRNFQLTAQEASEECASTPLATPSRRPTRTAATTGKKGPATGRRATTAKKAPVQKEYDSTSSEEVYRIDDTMSL
jgi:hypothetical protein